MKKAKNSFDRIRFTHIIPASKYIDEDEYALNDGIVAGELPALQRAGER